MRPPNQRNFNDPNVTYGYDSHDGNSTWSGICRLGSEWNYDMTEFNDQMQTGVNFLQQNPNARLGCIEFVGLFFDHLATPPSPISQSRLDWCRAHFEWAKKYDADWWYWTYLPPPFTETDCPQEIDGSDTKLTDNAPQNKFIQTLFKPQRLNLSKSNCVYGAQGAMDNPIP